MFKVVRIERYINTVFRDDFKFDTRQEAEDFFNQEIKKPEVVDISLYYCLPYREDHELTRFVRSNKGKTVVRKKI